jgi:hypothetical protein
MKVWAENNSLPPWELVTFLYGRTGGAYIKGNVCATPSIRKKSQALSPDFHFVPCFEELEVPVGRGPSVAQGQGMANIGDKTLYWYEA